MSVNLSDLEFFKLLKEATPENVKPTLENIRNFVKQFVDLVDTPANIPYDDKFFLTRDKHQLRLRYYHLGNDTKPLIIFFPGNGFIHDMFEENHSIISKIADTSGCNAVMVEFRLAPENPFPTPLNDALDAIHYICSHFEAFNADKDKIILAGFSSGANLAAVATNLLRDNQNIHIWHQLLISGGYDYTNSLHDFDEFALEDKMLDPESAQLSFDCYLSGADPKDPTCSPYWEEDLSHLPPTTILVGEYDGGRSQSEGYAEKLKKAGNQVDKIILPGQTHGTILYRKACSDGLDPAFVAGEHLRNLLTNS